MAIDYEVFEGKTLSDVFKDIYDNSKRNKEQLEVLMKEVVGFIKDGDTADGFSYSFIPFSSIVPQSRPPQTKEQS